MADAYIDDADPRVQYSWGWGIAGVSQEYHSTTHWTEQPGANATLAFSGTGIRVYGTIGPGVQATAPVTQYSIDSVAQVVYYAFPMGNAIQYNVRFFSSQPLQNGQHTIVITNLVNCTPAFYLDYLVVQTSNVTSSSESPSSTSTRQTAISTAINTTLTGSSTILLSSSTPNLNSTAAVAAATSPITTNTSSPSTSIIVGAAVGSFALISILIFVVWFLRRRLWRSESKVEPYDINLNPVGSSTGAPPNYRKRLDLLA